MSPAFFVFCFVFCFWDNLVENVPPERFQNQETASGTQGGAVLFAPAIFRFGYVRRSAFDTGNSGHGTPCPYSAFHENLVSPAMFSRFSKNVDFSYKMGYNKL